MSTLHPLPQTSYVCRNTPKKLANKAGVGVASSSKPRGVLSDSATSVFMGYLQDFNGALKGFLKLNHLGVPARGLRPRAAQDHHDTRGDGAAAARGRGLGFESFSTPSSSSSITRNPKPETLNPRAPQPRNRAPESHRDLRFGV